MADERLVPDTNTVVSALLWKHSVPAKALRRARQCSTLIASEAGLVELLSVLIRPKFDRYFDWNERHMLYLRYVKDVKIVEVKETVQVCRDPADDKFLSLALAGNAQTIMTGDTDLLAMHPFRGISILRAADYLKLL